MSNVPVVPTPHGGPETYLGKTHDIQFNRDCVHVACYQVELEEAWNIQNPAQMLKINKEGKAVPTDDRDKAIGILDPFIQDTYDLKSGDKVWLILFPGMIRSLSHYWEHEAFPPAPVEQSFANFKQNEIEIKESNIPSDKLESYRYLSDIAEDLDITLDRLLEEASMKAVDDDHYYVGRDEAEGYHLSHKFWFHYQNYTNSIVPEAHQNNFISCSC